MKCRKKLDVDCVVMEEMLFGVRLCIVLQGKEMLLVLDLCCVARKVMP